MSPDDRIDRDLPAALDWEARRRAAQQPAADRAIAELAERLGPAPTLGRPRIRPLPGLSPTDARALWLLVLVALLVAATVIVLIVGAPRPTIVSHVSQRHAYALTLPSASWRVVERPGTWEPGAFIEANSPGVDYLEERGADGAIVEREYFYLSSQPVPDFMTVTDWVAGHDAVNELWQPCFEMVGAPASVVLDGVPARVATFRCEDFQGSGRAWTTIQTLAVHGERGYAFYYWPADQGADMPPTAELGAASDRWIDRFEFR